MAQYKLFTASDSRYRYFHV